jgi:hypothetical protein
MTVRWFNARQVLELAAIAIVALVIACRTVDPTDPTATPGFYLALIFGAMLQFETAQFELKDAIFAWFSCGVGCVILRGPIRKIKAVKGTA